MRITLEPVGKREILLAVIISLVLLAIDFSSILLFPSVWCDEVSFGEPAINLAKQGRFETSVWPAQPAGTFWTANTPLYPLALSGWIHCFGHTLLALRSLNYVLITLACLGIWFFAWCFELSKNPTSRLLLIPLIHLSYGVSFAYRSIRPDILGLCILIMYVASLRLSHSKLRYFLLVACGITAVWTGPQLGIIIGISILLAYFFRWVQFKDVVATATGGILGAGSIAFILYYHHAIPDFMASVTLGRTGGTGTSHPLPTKALKTLFSYVSDFSLIPLLATSFYLTIDGWRNFDRVSRQQVGFFWFLVLVIPALLNTTSTYGYYYSYMVYIPTCFLLLITSKRIRQSEPTAKWRTRYIPIAAIVAAVAVGLPTRMMIASYCINATSRTAITQNLQRHIHPDDVAVVENVAFFEVKSITPRVFGELYFRFGKISESEKATVDVLVIYPKDLNQYASRIGGKWEPQGEPFGDTMIVRLSQENPIFKRLLDRHLSTPQMTRAPLQVYRRSTSRIP